MARHGRAGKDAIPPGNLPGHAPDEPAAQDASVEDVVKSRGRTAKTHPQGPQSTEPHTPQVMRREVSRPMAAGVKKRGDRRDTSADPGMRGNAGNRSVRQALSGAPASQKNVGGKRVSNNRSRGKSK